MLTKRQKQVAQALFEGQLTLEEVMEKYRLRAKVLRRWMDKEEFQGLIKQLEQIRHKQTELALSRYAPLAAVRLAELVGDEKSDVARRAAVDLLDRCLKKSKAEEAKRDLIEQMSDEEAREMLLKLAEGMR